MSMEIALNKKKGFTLAEALITLVILGVIAALTIPAVLVNTEQNEYKTAFKKALSVLNQVIELTLALDGYGPVETVSMQTNPDDELSIYNFFRNRMSVISTSDSYDGGGTENYAFFTADGLRYEFPDTPEIPGSGIADQFSPNNSQCARHDKEILDESGEVRNKPCLVVVDVNGDRKPNPRKARDYYKVPKADGASRILDVFPVVVTDVNAYPYGVIGQRALFQHN